MPFSPMSDDKLDDIQGRNANPPRVYRDGDALAFATGRADRQLYGDDCHNPFMIVENRDAWDRGYRSARLA